MEMPAKKGSVPWNKGVPHTEETKRRISETIKRQYENGREPWNKGKHLSKELREKISRAKKGKLIGEDNPFYGKHHSEETKRRISSALKGQKLSSEHKKGISAGLKRAYLEGRRVAWLKGRHLSQEIKEKISESLKQAYCEGRREAWMKGKPSVFKGRQHTEEAKEKNRQAHLGKKPTKRQLEALEEGWGWLKGRKNPILSKLNKNLEFQKKRLQGLLERPTKPETRVIEVIKAYNLPYCYVGDGKVVIDGLCPDFINNNGAKRIIEVFGDVYHDPDKSFKEGIPYNQTEDGRKEIFAKFGFETLILWTSQINKMVDGEIAEVIRRFEV